MWSLLFPLFSRAFLRGLQTTTSATCDLNTPYNQAACVPSSKVTRNVPGTPRKNPRTAAASVMNTAFITSLPLSFSTAAEILVLCTSRPIHSTSLMRVLLSGVAECSNHCRLLRNGRPFILRGASLFMFSAGWMRPAHRRNPDDVDPGLRDAARSVLGSTIYAILSGACNLSCA